MCPVRAVMATTRLAGFVWHISLCVRRVAFETLGSDFVINGVRRMVGSNVPTPMVLCRNRDLHTDEPSLISAEPHVKMRACVASDTVSALIEAAGIGKLM